MVVERCHRKRRCGSNGIMFVGRTFAKPSDDVYGRGAAFALKPSACLHTVVGTGKYIHDSFTLMVAVP